MNHSCLHVDPGTDQVGVASAENAPSDALVNGTKAVSGTYDSGDVCASESTAYIYVKSNCTDQATVGITVSIAPLLKCLLHSYVLQESSTNVDFRANSTTTFLYDCTLCM